MGCPTGSVSGFAVEVRAVFVSPHLDDAVWSVGSFLAEWGPRATVVTLFAGSPPGRHVAPLASELLKKAGLPSTPREALAARRAEDEQALRLLGCAARHWPLWDAIFRGPSVCDESQLYRLPTEIENGLACGLAAALGQAGASFFVPLGVGGHVDHRITFRVGRELRKLGLDVSFWADWPYVLHDPPAPPKGLSLREKPTTVQALAAGQEYRSQVRGLFGSAGEFRKQRMRVHEQVWSCRAPGDLPD